MLGATDGIVSISSLLIAISTYRHGRGNLERGRHSDHRFGIEIGGRFHSDALSEGGAGDAEADGVDLRCGVVEGLSTIPDNIAGVANALGDVYEWQVAV